MRSVNLLTNTLRLWSAMLAALVILAVGTLSPQVNAQTITTFAGGETGSALSTNINPVTTLRDSAGNIFFADSENHRVRKIAPDGSISTVAGTGVAGGMGDGGQAANAQLNFPRGLAIDGAGNLYVSEQIGHRIRKITPAGVISRFAGTGTAGFADDGALATAAQFDTPTGIAVSATGDLYVADFFNNRIRRVFTNGNVVTYAGTGVAGSAGDGGAATAAQLNGPIAITLAASGTLYVADRFAATGFVASPPVA